MIYVNDDTRLAETRNAFKSVTAWKRTILTLSTGLEHKVMEDMIDADGEKTIAMHDEYDDDGFMNDGWCKDWQMEWLWDGMKTWNETMSTCDRNIVM